VALIIASLEVREMILATLRGLSRIDLADQPDPRVEGRNSRPWRRASTRKEAAAD